MIGCMDVLSRPAEELSYDDVTLRRWRAADADLAYRLVSESLEHLRPLDELGGGVLARGRRGSTC